MLGRRFVPALVSWSLLIAGLASAGESRRWQSGVLLGIDSQMMVKRGIMAYSPAERRYYKVDPGKDSPVVYVLIQEESKQGNLAVVTVNQTIRFAIEGERVYVMDEKGREIKMKIFSKMAREAESPPPAATAAVAPAEQEKSGDIKKGMTTDEVERLLGKPTRTVGFERKSQWLYRKLTVVFDEGRVVDVSF